MRAAPSTGPSGRSRGAARRGGPSPSALPWSVTARDSCRCHADLTHRPDATRRLARRRAGDLRGHAGRRVGARRRDRRRGVPGVRSTRWRWRWPSTPASRVHVHHDERSGRSWRWGSAWPPAGPRWCSPPAAPPRPSCTRRWSRPTWPAVPLLACTGRPPARAARRRRPQAIDQVHLYGGRRAGTATRACPRRREPAAGGLRGPGVATTGPPPGPVHLNLPFREPLVGARAAAARPRRRPWTSGWWGARVLPAAGGAGRGRPGRRRAEPALPADVGDRTAWPGAPGADRGRSRRHRRRGAARRGARARLAGGGRARSPAWVAGPALVRTPTPWSVVPGGRCAAAGRDRPVGAPGSSRGRGVAGRLRGRPRGRGRPGWSDPSATVAVQVDDPAVPGRRGRPRPAADAGDRRAVVRPALAGGRVAAADAVDRALGDVPARRRRDHRSARSADVPVGCRHRAGGRRAVVRAPPAGRAPGGVVVDAHPRRRALRARPGRSQRAVIVHANRGANGIDGVVSTAVGVAVDRGTRSRC